MKWFFGMSLVPILIWIVCIAAWLNHIIYCFQHGAWLRLLVLAILAPLGIVDGFGLWFGWWH